MYINAIKAVVSIKSPTDRASKPVSNPVRGHLQRNQARATGRCNSHTRIGARELRTITGHSSIEAAAPVDPVVVAGVVAAAEEGNINRELQPLGLKLYTKTSFMYSPMILFIFRQ